MISCLFISSLIMNSKISLQRNFSGVPTALHIWPGGVELDGPNFLLLLTFIFCSFYSVGFRGISTLIVYCLSSTV
jgi:hypothetical protein